MLRVEDLFDLTQTDHRALFEGVRFPWEALSRIADYLRTHLQPALHNTCDGVAWIGQEVYIGPGTIVEDGAMIRGPAMIGRNCRIAHNAYIRENVLIGDGCIIGNATEIKNAILFNGCQVPHHNYIGDSILGASVHLGAGVKLSNVKLLPGPITVHWEGEVYPVDLEKLGALIGDGAQIGCNAVLSPGSVIGRGAVIYPCLHWRGSLPAGHIAKSLDQVIRFQEGKKKRGRKHRETNRKHKSAP